MNCPVCAETNLVISERQGVEIDYCPKCRGVWLDRGELDKIIERANEISDNNQSMRFEDKRYPNEKKYDNNHYKKNKRKSFFDELFDF